MYVVVESHSGHVLAFGLTPKKADADFVRRDVWYDGPPLETRRCSPALYRRLEALDRSGSIFCSSAASIARGSRSARRGCL
jgi:hypothetical protein